jgi:5-(carboxyamino)imidazole ribonucleotide synthase
MVNLIGSVPDLGELLGLPRAHAHLYGKDSREGRKVGHVTLVDPDEETAASAVALAGAAVTQG